MTAAPAMTAMTAVQVPALVAVRVTVPVPVPVMAVLAHQAGHRVPGLPRAMHSGAVAPASVRGP
jgi:hypothetical protein